MAHVLGIFTLLLLLTQSLLTPNKHGICQFIVTINSTIVCFTFNYKPQFIHVINNSQICHGNIFNAMLRLITRDVGWYKFDNFPDFRIPTTAGKLLFVSQILLLNWRLIESKYPRTATALINEN